MKNHVKTIVTATALLLAAGVILFKYWQYAVNPWTRDGQVEANVILIAPRVSAPIVNLPIKDNQFVKAGDALFEIDPRTFKAKLDEAQANLEQTRNRLQDLEAQVRAGEAAVNQSESRVEQARSQVASAQAQFDVAKKDLGRAEKLVKEQTIAQRRYDQAKEQYEVTLAKVNQVKSVLLEAQAASMQAQAELARVKAELGAPGDKNPQLRAAKATLEEAKLNYEFTKVKAPVDGYVTNLNLRLGSQAVANQPALALVDVKSYWIVGFFQETQVKDIKPGDKAVVTLMSYPDAPLAGRVDSIGWGIAQSDGATGQDLLPNINPTFEWIRLAQRLPVRVHLDGVPEGVALRVGATASVLVMTGEKGEASAPALPAALQ